MTATTLLAPQQSRPALEADNQVQLVACQSSGHGFALRTDNLSGVHQLSRQQLADGVDQLETAEGVFPIVSLADLLSDRLNISMEADPEDRALLAVHVGDQMLALRVGDVSRAIMADYSSFYPLPKVAHPSDQSGIFDCIAVINPEADHPKDVMRLVFDPAVALGIKQADSTAKHLSQVAQRTAQNVPRRDGGGANQLLAFMPEDTSQDPTFLFVLPLSMVAEVTTAHEIMPIGMSSELLEGYIFWRKQPVPVIRLGHSFGLSGNMLGGPSDTKDGRRLVVARTSGNRLVAFYAQSQMQTLRIANAETADTTHLQGCPYAGAFKTEMGILVVPDLEQVLDCSASKLFGA